MDDVNVYIIGMDPMVNEQVVANNDGSYSIFINDCLSPEHRVKAYKHAMRHIERDDFNSEEADVDRIEYEVHCG